MSDTFAIEHKLIISRPCGCTVSASVNLTDADDLAFAREIQRKRCLTHR